MLSRKECWMFVKRAKAINKEHNTYCHVHVLFFLYHNKFPTALKLRQKKTTEHTHTVIVVRT